MSFYKLFQVIHNHTGFEGWRYEIDRMMYPEYYAAKRKEARTTLAQLMAVHSLVGGLGGHYL